VWELGRVRFEHVRREFNADADRLANEAMDGQKQPEA
jgi:ribonuclease HI